MESFVWPHTKVHLVDTGEMCHDAGWEFGNSFIVDFVTKRSTTTMKSLLRFLEQNLVDSY